MRTVTYKDCMLAAAEFLRLDAAAAVLAADGAAEDADTARDIDALAKCVELVLHEVACDYAPLKKTERLTAAGGEIFYRDLSKNVIDIYAVKSGGIPVRFSCLHDRLRTDGDGVYDVEYSYEPQKGGAATLLEWDGERIGPRTVGYGAACEYCILCGNPDDAAFWDKRFKDALFKADSPKHALKIAERPWR